MSLYLTPKRVVEELDKYIVGQFEAKKAVAIALRTRILRKKLPKDMQEEVSPKNILMIGPTGVGKTEIARRLAKIIKAPFLKVEATKYTEVGYVGKDVESIIRDLVEVALKNVKDERMRYIEVEAKLEARAKVLKELLNGETDSEICDIITNNLEKGLLNDAEIEIDVQAHGAPFNSFEIPFQGGTASACMIQVGDILGKAAAGSQKRRKKMTVKEAIESLESDIIEDYMERDETIEAAIKLAEEGVVFIDEIDKIAISNNAKGGEVSREGVQRDLLPLIEGTNVQTRYGNVKTDQILFIASGAFHCSKPSDLSPELQGRFPIRVELKPLEKMDMINILTKPKASLQKQYQALLKVEGINLIFTEDGIDEMADIAIGLNTEIENIGARRLHTLMEKTLEDILFDAKKFKNADVVVDKLFVQVAIKNISGKIDVAKFIL